MVRSYGSIFFGWVLTSFCSFYTFMASAPARDTTEAAAFKGTPTFLNKEHFISNGLSDLSQPKNPLEEKLNPENAFACVNTESQIQTKKHLPLRIRRPSSSHPETALYLPRHVIRL